MTRLVLVGGFLAASACSFVFPVDDLSSGGSAPTGGDDASAGTGFDAARGASGGDGDAGDDGAQAPEGATDAVADAAADADAAPPVNLFVGGDFETATPSSCQNGINAFQGTAGGSTTSHTGSWSCQVCSNGTGASYTIDGFYFRSPVVGATYHGQAWVRAPDGSTATQTLKLYLRSYDQGQEINYQASATLALTQQWQLIETDWQLPGPCDSLNLYIANEASSSGECFLTDDVALYRVQ